MRTIVDIEGFKVKVVSAFPDSNLTPTTENEQNKLKSLFPKLPNDYLSFLKIIGHGTFGDCGFSIYAGPLEADEIFDNETATELNNYIFIGDDFSGWMLAYDISKTPYELTFFNHNEKVELNNKEKNTLVDFLNIELFER